MSTQPPSTTTPSTHISEIYHKCRHCKEEMWQTSQFTLKERLRQHRRVCEKYDRDMTKYESERYEQDIEARTREGQRRARARLQFILQASLEISRLQEKMKSPSISNAEKQFKIAGEIREAESIKSFHTKGLQEDCTSKFEKNEFTRAGTKKEIERWNGMTKEEKIEEYLFRPS